MASRKQRHHKTNNIGSGTRNSHAKLKSKSNVHNAIEENQEASSTVLTPANAANPNSDLVKEYIRFCNLYSSEPLDIISKQLENATLGDNSILLDLKGRGLRGVDCIALGKLLGLDAPITNLNLSDCLLLPQGLQALIDGICKNSRLQILELRGNNIGGGMTVTLAKLLKTNFHLKRLILEWNCLGTAKETFDCFCDALATNTALQHLDLRNNSISAECATQLATSLLANKSLRELDLRWNSIGLVGAKAIWESLRFNFTLQTLHLCGNYIPDEIIKCIEQCLQHQTERDSLMEEYSKRTTILTRQLKQTEQEHQNEIQQIVSTFETEENELKNAIKESYSQIAELDSQLQYENQKNHSLTKQVEKLQTSLECATEKEETLRKALEIKEEHSEQLETFFNSELDKLKLNHEYRIKNYQDELEGRYKHVESLSSKISKLESLLESKSSELEACQERIDIMKKNEVENRKVFEERIKAEREKWDSWKNEVETSEKKEIHNLEEEIVRTQSSLGEQIKKLEKAKNEAEDEVRELKINFTSFKSESEGEYTKLRLKLTAEHDKALQDLAAQLIETKNHVMELQSLEQKRSSELSKFENENIVLGRQNEHLREQISNMDKELIVKDAAIHNALAKARSEVKVQIEQLGKEEEANKTLRNQILGLQEQLTMLTLEHKREIQEKFAEMDHWKIQVERREAELSRLKEEDMRRAALLHETFLAYMRSTSAATGIPLPSSSIIPELVHISSKQSSMPRSSGAPSGDAPDS